VLKAAISSNTRAKLDRFTEAHGLKESYVVEQALLLFMEARREMPDEALLPVRIDLDETGCDEVVAMLEAVPAVRDSLKGLMRSGGG